METATGFDLEALPNGTVLIEFFGDDGKTFNKQVVTPDIIRKMPLVAMLTALALRRGPDAVKRIMEQLSDTEHGG
jgi:hypothetical protein